MAVTEKKITLSEPLSIDGKELTELTMRKGNIGDMIDAHESAEVEAGRKPSDALVELHLLAILCGIAAPDLRQMGFGDYGKLLVASAFLSEGGASPQQ